MILYKRDTMKINTSFFQPLLIYKAIVPDLSSQTARILLAVAAVFSCLAFLWVMRNYFSIVKPQTLFKNDMNHKSDSTKVQTKEKKNEPVSQSLKNLCQPSSQVTQTDSKPQAHPKDSMSQPLEGKSQSLSGGLFRQDYQKSQATLPVQANTQCTGQYAFGGSINGQKVSIQGDHIQGIDVHVNGSFVEKIDYQTFMQQGYKRNFNGATVNIPPQVQKVKKQKQNNPAPLFPIGIMI